MIARPSFPLLYATLLGLGVVSTLLVAPLEYLWARVDPLGHAAWELRHTSTFTGPAYNDVGELALTLAAWRRVARSAAADSIFRQLAATGSAAGRVYGVAGLALTDSGAAAQVAAALRADTTRVYARLGPCEELVERRVGALVALVRRPAVARYLLHGAPDCRDSARPSTWRSAEPDERKHELRGLRRRSYFYRSPVNPASATPDHSTATDAC